MRDVKRLFAAEDVSQPLCCPDPAPKPLRPAGPLVGGLPMPDFRLAPPLSPPPPSRIAGAAGLDRRTEDKLRKGRFEIDGRLDLHGLTLQDAHSQVTSYIRLQHAAGKRCLLIITGKGRESNGLPKGQLRQNLPLWLEMPPLAPLILSVTPAQPRHGGQGAFYVLLRRQRG